MKCISEFKDASYGSDVFCKVCGMNIGLEAVIVIRGGIKGPYCCEECAKLK
jgi:hypothetical protein